MKKKILKLAKEIQRNGVGDKLCKVNSPDQMDEIWKEFIEQNPDLILRVKKWGKKFAEKEYSPLFEKGEEIKYPLEIALIIYIIGSEVVTENDLFENFRDLSEALESYDSAFTDGLSISMEHTYIFSLTAKDICEAPVTYESYFTSEEVKKLFK